MRSLRSSASKMKAQDGFAQLPDCLVLKILSNLQDVGHIRRAAACCNRFLTLSNEIEELKLDFNTLPLAVEAKHNHAIGRMLARAAVNKAPTCVHIVYNGDGYPDQHSVPFWIACACPSLKKLTIEGAYCSWAMTQQMAAASHCPHLSHLNLASSREFEITSDGLATLKGGFRVLQTLHLEQVHMSSQSLDELLCCCSNLRRLTLLGLSGMAEVKIASKTLTFLKINMNGGFYASLIVPAFSEFTLDMPALTEAFIGDLSGTLTVKNAPLKDLTVNGYTADLDVDLGSQAMLQSLTPKLDDWPRSHGLPMAWGTFMAILEQTKPHHLQMLSMPPIESRGSVPWLDVQSCFLHLVQLKAFDCYASFLVACMLGCTQSQMQELLKDLEFKSLSSLHFYVDSQVLFWFDALEAIVKGSKHLKDLFVHADSESRGFEVSGIMVSRILDFQYSHSNLKVHLNLPKVMVGKQ